MTCTTPSISRAAVRTKYRGIFERIKVSKSVFKNNLAVCIICVFRFQGWRDGHGRQGSQANPSVSLSRVSLA